MTLSATDKCYRMARRERLRTWYKKNGDGFELSKDYFTGDFGEAERLKELKGVRAMLAFEDWNSEVVSDAQTRSDAIEEDEDEIDETELEFLFEDEDELDIDDLEHEHSRMMEEDYALWRQRADAEFERYPDLGPLL
ncbi:hypothetical protein MPH_02019 [Macrophomina phaseolina MS6]|uniref:Uncharacterized protein n=1 Tax=Macrophomina phaseolina (strain MS6) TaxID=1126212 RepID=K2SE26_MACPH|nr:hypothetical protein MPH_02019 [Macrophomina phaseolina MS6]